MNTGTGSGSPRDSGSSRGHRERTGSTCVPGTGSSPGMDRGARSEDRLSATGHQLSSDDHLLMPIRSDSEGGNARRLSHSSTSSLQRRRKLSTASKVLLKQLGY